MFWPCIRRNSFVIVRALACMFCSCALTVRLCNRTQLDSKNEGFYHLNPVCQNCKPVFHVMCSLVLVTALYSRADCSSSARIYIWANLSKIKGMPLWRLFQHVTLNKICFTFSLFGLSSGHNFELLNWALWNQKCSPPICSLHEFQVLRSFISHFHTSTPKVSNVVRFGRGSFRISVFQFLTSYCRHVFVLPTSCYVLTVHSITVCCEQ